MLTLYRIAFILLPSLQHTYIGNLGSSLDTHMKLLCFKLNENHAINEARKTNRLYSTPVATYVYRLPLFFPRHL